MRRDLINTAILWFVLTFIAELLLPGLYSHFPLAAAKEATLSDDSFHVLLVLGTPVFTFVLSVLGYSLVNFRARGDKLETVATFRNHDAFAGTWLAITGGLCVLVIIYPGLTGLAEFQGNRNPDLIVKVVGRQWAWDISYPSLNVNNLSEVVLPVNKRIKFEISSADVLHSFWIPAFRDKMDAVPGTTTAMYITPDKVVGFDQDYNMRVQCTEICGTGHSKMSVPVRVLSQADFDKWASEQSALTSSPAARGAALAKSQGCTACHSLDGSVIVGPSWKDLYGSQVQFEDGSSTLADDAYLKQFITNPDFKVVKGFATKVGIMPKNFGTNLTAAQISDIVAYMKTLSKNTASVPSSGASAPAIARPSNPGGSGQALSLKGDPAAGAKIFADNCKVCHGDQGKGGVANPGSTDGTVPTLNPIDETMKDDDPKVFAYNIDLFPEHGSTPDGPNPALRMPAWGDSKTLNPQQIADVIAYIMSLNK